jgi:hypothetical protein
VGNGQRAVATDADERIEFHRLEHCDHAIAVVERPLGRFDRLGKRVAAVDSAEDGTAQAQNTGAVARREDARLLRIDQAVEAVFQTNDLNVGIVRGLDDCADHRIQARRIATACQDPDFLDRGHETVFDVRLRGVARSAATAVTASLACQP